MASFVRLPWYAEFARILITNGTIADLQQRLSEITLIVFNYDRCIEHYLHHAFQTYYKLTAAESANIVQSMEIFHPYGSVGGLSWYQGHSWVDYGEVCGGERLFKVAGELRTFTEGADQQSTRIDKFRQRLQEAELVVFLGFAFHSLNLDLLFPRGQEFRSRDNTRVFATAKEFSANDRAAINGRLRQRFNNSRLIAQMDDWTCYDLFRNNQIGLSLA